MKLPEHYEKWLDVQCTPLDALDLKVEKRAVQAGADMMYRKMMTDFAPAIEALKHYASGTWEIECDEFISTAANQALAALKEKGLVE